MSMSRLELEGVVGRTDDESEGRPNVVIVLLEDVGCRAELTPGVLDQLVIAVQRRPRPNPEQEPAGTWPPSSTRSD